MILDAAEYERRHRRLRELAEFFRAHTAEWIDARTLEGVAGRCAWRSRVSELRTKLGMTVENKQERLTVADGTFAVLSSYRYLPHVPLGPDASADRTQRSLF